MIDSYYRLRNTWKMYDERIQQLLIANIKAQLACLIGDTQKRQEIEATVPCVIEDGDEYANELQKEFEDATALTTQLPDVPSTSETQKSSGKRMVDKPDAVSNQIFADLDEEENGATEVDEPASHTSD